MGSMLKCEKTKDEFHMRKTNFINMRVMGECFENHSQGLLWEHKPTSMKKISAIITLNTTEKKKGADDKY